MRTTCLLWFGGDGKGYSSAYVKKVGDWEATVE